MGYHTQCWEETFGDWSRITKHAKATQVCVPRALSIARKHEVAMRLHMGSRVITIFANQHPPHVSTFAASCTEQFQDLLLIQSPQILIPGHHWTRGHEELVLKQIPRLKGRWAVESPPRWQLLGEHLKSL